MSVAVGDRAPTFRLPATGGRHVLLDDYFGNPVVLVFYPGDDSPICTRQLTTYNEALSQFAALNAHVLAISAQSVESHERFTSKHDFGFPLLSDVDKAVAEAIWHAWSSRFRAPQRVRDRRRRHHSLRASCDSRHHLSAGRRAGRRVARPFKMMG